MEISVREFTQKPTKYLAKLPIVLTQYNKPVAIVNKYDTSADTSNHDAKNLTDLAAETERVSESASTSADGRCEAPQGCRGRGLLYHVTYMADDGEHIVNKHLCPLHLRQAKKGAEVTKA